MNTKTSLILSLVVNVILLALLGYKHGAADVTQPKMNLNSQGIEDMRGNRLSEVSVVMLGNSITYQGNWQEELERDDVFNGGKPGWTTQQLSWVIKDFIIPHKPKICFFKGGTNDISLGIPTERIIQNMQMVMDSIQAVGTIPVYTPTIYFNDSSAPNGKIDQVNDSMKSFCIQKNYHFMDIRPVLCGDQQTRDAFYKEDNTHLHQKAYEPWAKMVEEVLASYGI